eukprot:5312705-Prymnesium_polylepis.1
MREAEEYGKHESQQQLLPAEKLSELGLGELGETDKRALQRMIDGSSVLLSASGQKPRPHFLQLSADFSVLRWSWTGYVLLHELVGLQVSRHPNYKTPCITLLMNTYGLSEGRHSIDVICLEAREFRQWMTGLRVLQSVQQPNMHCLPSDLVSLVLATFHAADKDRSGMLSSSGLLEVFARLNVLKDNAWVLAQLEKLQVPTGDGHRAKQGRIKVIEFQQLLSIYYDEVGGEGEPTVKGLFD